MKGHSKKNNAFEVVVIGAGPLGWACSHFLTKKSIRTCLIDSETAHAAPEWMHRGLGVFWPSLNDPPTRAVVAHGPDMANFLQDFCLRGRSRAPDLLGTSSVREARTLRIALEPHELVELQKAAKNHLGLAESEENNQQIFTEKANAWVLTSEGKSFLKSNQSSYLTTVQGTVTTLEDSIDGCRILCADGSSFTSEMVIVATGHRIPQLEPWLTQMLIPMSDILSIWSTNLPASNDKQPLALRTSSGHVACVFIPEKNSTGACSWVLKMTGPRFLLPQAGAGVDLSQNIPDELLKIQIETWLKKNLIPKVAPFISEKDFAADKKIEIKLKHIGFGVDCLPCDELPMLGELGRQGRVLSATGWLGCGWSAGFEAAAILSEIIHSGQSSGLKPLLRPQRWRSGMNDGVTGMT